MVTKKDLKIGIEELGLRSSGLRVPDKIVLLSLQVIWDSNVSPLNYNNKEMTPWTVLVTGKDLGTKEGSVFP